MAAKVFTGPVATYATHTAHFGRVIDPISSHVIDEVLLLVMRRPRSYTGEETVEIHCHGGRLIARRILEAILSTGARPASPGEFTFRAYMNGKIDLAQAEAVQSVIGARSDLALQVAGSQLRGRLSRRVTEFQRALIDVAATIEAWVDFPEEGLDFTALHSITTALRSTQENIEELSSTFYEGQRIHDGIALCLAGRPNVGKSSLMNALLGKDRAIVTDVPGTTRDLLDADLEFGGIPFRLIDTAGIRVSEEVVEREGVRRSREAIGEADLILAVVDGSEGLTPSDEEVFAPFPESRRLTVWNKADLPTSHLPPAHAVAVSAKTGEGIAALKEAIIRLVLHRGVPSKDEIVITQVRHREALGRAVEFLERVLRGLADATSPELLAADLRSALLALSEIQGVDVTEEILSAIFAKFCVGK
jgi:tRNA modification GTPase